MIKIDNYICTCFANDMHIDIVNEASNTGGANIQRRYILLVMTIFIHFRTSFIYIYVFFSLTSELHFKLLPTNN